MTTSEVKERVEKIREVAHDDEVAHSMEDQLHEDVLTFIASQETYGALMARHMKELATIALTTREISFARWCA